MTSTRRWQLDLATEVAILPAPSKTTADDYAGVVAQGDDYAVGAVCDGVTGREGQGGIAAARTLEELRGLEWPAGAGVRAIEQRLTEAVRRANAALLRERQPGRRNGSPPTTTCTVGAVYVYEGRCYATAAWVGDSPATVVTPYEMRLLTPPDQDHATSSPAALGVREEVAVEVRTVEVGAGQALLLHSDGFGLDESECLRVYKNTVGDRHGWSKFLEQAMQLSRPSSDDKSALVIGIVGEPVEQPAPAEDFGYVAQAPAVRTPAPVRGQSLGLRPAVLIPIILIALVLGWLLGRSGLTGVPAPIKRGGITALGQPFAADGKTGAVLSLSTLLGENETEVPNVQWPVYTLAPGLVRPRLVMAGRLTLAPKGPEGEGLLLLDTLPKGSRIYVDGARVKGMARIAPSPVRHQIEVYTDSPPSKWGCEVTATSEGLSVKPLKARPEPKP